jgi:hypothetical protein
VVARRRRNIERVYEPVDRAIFWEALVSALLTTQQRAGPRSPVTRFIRSQPFPLRLNVCLESHDCRHLVESTIETFGGIRRAPSIATEVASNLAWLEAGGWSDLLPRLRELEKEPGWQEEREAARALASRLSGIGPKQSRNVLQMLGLTRYETPLDSRVTKWLEDFGFPVRVSATALADEAYYEFAADGFRALCTEADVVPCLMDAAIFVSFDKEAYSEEVMRW